MSDYAEPVPSRRAPRRRPRDQREAFLRDSLALERLHERTYLDFGFRLVNVPAGPLTDRVAVVQQAVAGVD
jgi:predicted ATPase